MKIAVLGTGMVGETIATKLIALGHDVSMGSRTASNERGKAWLDAVRSERARLATFTDAVAGSDLVFLCTSGAATMEVLASIGDTLLGDRILVDVTNPLAFAAGGPPTLSICNDDSQGEAIQRTYPRLRVVKSLNTINCKIMVEPRKVPGDHVVFVSGNDAAAKEQVTALLRDGFGWPRIVDLGDITTARGTEAYLLLWLRLWRALGHADFNMTLAGADLKS